MVTPLDNLNKSLSGYYDVFIASASYETRSLSIMKELLKHNNFTYKYVSYSLPHSSLIQDNLSIFIENGFTPIEVNNTNQIETVNNLVSLLNTVLIENPNSSFLVDISTFTRQTLLILLRLLRNSLSSNNKIKFLYTPAKEYSIGLSYADKWLTRGVLSVSSVFGFSGIIKPSRPYHLIVLMGFEVERALALVEAYEPSKITIGYAKKCDSVSEEYYELNKNKFEQLLSEFPIAKSFEFSCINVKNSKNELLSQVQKYNDYNTVISPMNNKISTVACALAAFDNDAIQLAIALPAIYNHINYSIPSDKCYLVEIPNFIK